MAVLLPILLLAFSFPALGALGPEPEIPKPGVDMVLTGGKTAREFFEDRAKDAACQDDLKKAKQEYRKLIQQVSDLKKTRKVSADGKEDAELASQNNKIDSFTIPVDEARVKLLQYMEKCGECATRPLELVEVDKGAGKTQKWYVSNGSCQIPSKDPAVLAKAFDILSESLVHADQYPKSVESGFANILAFKVGNSADLRVLNVDRFPSGPFSIYLWVLGPKLAGIQAGFYYYMSALYSNSPVNGVKSFNLDFQTAVEPRLKGNWKAPGAPELFDTTLSGRKGSVTWIPLKNVKGQWYTNGDGYIRYYTSAEFPLKIDEIERKGRKILIDTLTEAASRGKWETP